MIAAILIIIGIGLVFGFFELLSEIKDDRQSWHYEYETLEEWRIRVGRNPITGELENKKDK